MRRLTTMVIILAAMLAAVSTVWAGGQQEAAGSAAAQEEVVLSLARFFGDCDDTTTGVTDVSQATTECEVIQILTNKFNAENESGIVIERLGGAEWGSYYDGLNTSFAGGDPPDVAVMHGSNLPDYADRGLLQSLEGYYPEYGIDPADWTGPARGAVTYDGEYYGVAFDIHANLFHVNVDLFREAGLVDENGVPILPSSPEEFFEHAEAMREATGAWYFATDASQFPIGVRLMFSLVWQQNADLVSDDGSSATVDTPEAREAVEFMVRMFDEGYANPDFNYTASQEAFLSGEAAMEFLAFLNEHVGDWAAGTGHLAPRSSVLAGDQLQQAPQRANYQETASIAQMVPAIQNWQAVEDILKEEIEATWLTGASVDEAVSQADTRINEVLSR